MAEDLKLTAAERSLIEENRRREAQQSADEAARQTKEAKVNQIVGKAADRWTKDDMTLMNEAIVEYLKEL